MEDLNIDDWCVVYSFADEYIVKPKGGTHAVIQAIDEGNALVCEDALSYRTIPGPVVREDDSVVLDQQHSMTSVDMISGPVPFYVMVTAGYCIKDLTETDKNRYKTCVQEALAARR